MLLEKKFPISDYWVVFLWGLLLFVPFLGSVHLFDWDEINFAESAREMLVTGNYQKVQINFKPFTEKPPLFFWLQVISMKAFGINEFAARFPNAIIGIISLLLVFRLGKETGGRSFGLLWVLFVSGSFTPHLYFKSGIIDPLYNLFIFMAVVQLYRYTINNLASHAILLGTFLGFAIITKGPVAVIVLMLVFLVFWASQRFRIFFNWLHLFVAAFFAFLVSALWFGLETLENGPTFLIEFVKYQADLFLNPVAGHGQPFWYHPLVLLLGAFPASVVAIPALIGKKDGNGKVKESFLLFMRILFWVVLILFSLVETKIVHYSSLCYLPLTYLAAWQVIEWTQARVKHHPWQGILYVVIGSMIGVIFTVIPLADHWKNYVMPYIADPFAVASFEVSGEWQNWEWLPGLIFLGLVIWIYLQIRRNKVLNGLVTLLVLVSLFIPLVLKVVVPHIELYSQAPAINWYKQAATEGAYIETAGFKSYAQYFYGKVQAVEYPEASFTSHIQIGNIQKRAYLVTKVNDYQDHVNPLFKEVKREGGFILWVREPNPN